MTLYGGKGMQCLYLQRIIASRQFLSKPFNPAILRCCPHNWAQKENKSGILDG